MEPDNNPRETKKSGNFKLISVLILLVLIIGMVGYFLASKFLNSSIPGNSDSNFPPENPINTNSANAGLPPSENKNVNIPEDWTVYKSSVCYVDIPLPPQKEPYIVPDNPETTPGVNDEGGYWKLQEYSNQSGIVFVDGVTAVFGNPDAPGSGYVAGIVQVRCAENESNITTDTLLQRYVEYFKSDTQGLTLKKKGNTVMWGKNVEVLTVEGGMYEEGNEEYLFATDTHIYLISKRSMSTNELIRETTDKIFENLVF